MTPAQIERYYQSRAQQDQQLAESIATFLEAVFTVDPEKEAQRKQNQLIRNIPKYDRQYRRAQRQTERLIKKKLKRLERNKKRGTSF
jgi:hypothetical protein